MSSIPSIPSCADPFEEGLMSLEEALRKIEGRVAPVHACERLPIRECLDRVNNEAVLSPYMIPPHANSRSRNAEIGKWNRPPGG